MAATENGVSYELSHQYLLPDFPSKYHRELITSFKGTEALISASVGKIFQSGKYKGKTIVEVGCGPTIHRVAIPSKYYDVIITSDYSPENMESVRKWVAGDPDALDWTPLLENVAEVEGHSDIPSGVKEIEARLRQKIKSILHCDVLKQSIFDQKIDKADLLVTAGCLEGVCPSPESFASVLKNLGHHVKADGHLLIVTVLGMSSIEFDGRDILSLNIKKDFVTRAVVEAGFAIEHEFFKENDIPGVVYDGTNLIMARKL